MASVASTHHPEQGILLLRATFIAQFGYEPDVVHIRRSDLRMLIPLKLGVGVPKRFYGMDIVVHEDHEIDADTAYLVTTKKRG